MSRTIVYVAHPDVATSSSQQFLLSSGKQITDVTYIDLQSEFENKGLFDSEKERARLLSYDRIIFQFHLYWYQAPAILKLWLDNVLQDRQMNSQFARQLVSKELGLVVVAGVNEGQYQAGGREKRTLSELLSPFESLAHYYNMTYLPIFSVHQFAYMSELEKMELMYQYACYLVEGTHLSYLKYQRFLLEKLDTTESEQLNLSAEQEVLFELWKNMLEDQADEVSELFDLTDRW
ncbi:NAD(P)H-dependent oxidoreductase [Aerococcaceae bacterium DSM 111021]|nr:NAD(P)H-dependent oxidoreductase [Aerococcaceae bacterium DSM 111021]